MLTVSNLSLQFADRRLFHRVNIKFVPGNCYGIIGANGAGKSTFLRILSGDLEPSSGEVSMSKGQRMSVLGQDHYAFDAYTVLETVILGNPRLYQIEREKDELYAKPDFSDEDGERAAALEGEFADLGGWTMEADAATLLNSLGLPEDLHNKKMSALAGREKVKVILAQALFGTPDVLILDEPTNDLDVETLELLEEVLLNFPGTVLIVSHDRAFLDNVVTSTLVFEGQGKVREYVGGYQDWLRQGGSIRLLGVTEQRTGNKMPVAEAVSSAPAPVAVAGTPGEPGKKKLSYKLQRELEALPAQIESVEKQLAEVQAQIGQPSFYQQPAAQTQAVLARLQTLQSELDALLERWTELEA